MWARVWSAEGKSSGPSAERARMSAWIDGCRVWRVWMVAVRERAVVGGDVGGVDAVVVVEEDGNGNGGGGDGGERARRMSIESSISMTFRLYSVFRECEDKDAFAGGDGGEVSEATASYTFSSRCARLGLVRRNVCDLSVGRAAFSWKSFFLSRGGPSDVLEVEGDDLRGESCFCACTCTFGVCADNAREAAAADVVVDDVVDDVDVDGGILGVVEVESPGKCLAESFLAPDSCEAPSPVNSSVSPSTNANRRCSASRAISTPCDSGPISAFHSYIRTFHKR